MAELLLVLLLGLAGPLLAVNRRFAVPVAVGEILAGLIFGASGLKVIDATQPDLTLLSQIGFAVVMLVTGSHIDVRKIFSRVITLRALVNIALITGSAVLVGLLVQALTHSSGNFWTFVVIIASSSAAVALPVFAGEETNPKIAVFVTQVTIADLLAIVMLPLVTGGKNLVSVGVGALTVTLASGVIYLLLRFADSSGVWRRLRKLSAAHGFGLELRLSLILLLALILLAQSFTVTIMIAGFGLGLALGANGLPKRLAKQLFAVSEGLLSPVFFVILGAGIDVSAVLQQPKLIVLALALGLGAVLVHLAPTLLGMNPVLAVASSAQLGVPAAAVSIGLASHSLTSGEAAAVMLGALTTLAATAIAAAAKNRKAQTA
jgi:Kef-type K+ transport system membrane component KefB